MPTSFVRTCRSAPVLVVIAADDLDKIVGGERLRTRVLAQVHYFDASAVKLRTLLRPDPRERSRAGVVADESLIGLIAGHFLRSLNHRRLDRRK